MKNLNDDLKTGQFKNVYLLYGEEAYLKRMYKERFIKAMIPEGDTMNYAYYEGRNINVREVIDLAETMPFFAKWRLIVMEDTGLFKNAAPEMADYVKEIPDTTCILFLEQEIDKRGKLYKVVKSRGYAAELSFQDEKTLKKWILGFIKKENRKITEKTLDHFLQKVGTDMENIEKELEKLFSYTIGRSEITADDVDAVCTTQITNRIFDMVHAAAKGDQKEALDLYHDLLALKEPPMRILFLMTREFRLLFQVKELKKQHFDRKEIASRAGIHPFAAGKYMEQSRFYRSFGLRRILEEGVRTEEAVKTGKLADTLSVELFIIWIGEYMEEEHARDRSE